MFVRTYWQIGASKDHACYFERRCTLGVLTIIGAQGVSSGHPAIPEAVPYQSRGRKMRDCSNLEPSLNVWTTESPVSGSTEAVIDMLASIPKVVLGMEPESGTLTVTAGEGIDWATRYHL
jgi:hypothetical protein